MDGYWIYCDNCQSNRRLSEDGYCNGCGTHADNIIISEPVKKVYPEEFVLWLAEQLHPKIFSQDITLESFYEEYKNIKK